MPRNKVLSALSELANHAAALQDEAVDGAARDRAVIALRETLTAVQQIRSY